jgi:hypothetical protein
MVGAPESRRLPTKIIIALPCLEKWGLRARTLAVQFRSPLGR